MKERKDNGSLLEFMNVFFIVTTCITILEGTLGMLFFPNTRFGYDAFFSPPLCGFLTTLPGLILKSSKELTVKQVLFQRFVQLLMIEGIIFGINFLAGMVFEMKLSISLALAIAVIFIVVYFVLWLNDRRYAMLFNERLKAFQEEIKA